MVRRLYQRVAMAAVSLTALVVASAAIAQQYDIRGCLPPDYPAQSEHRDSVYSQMSGCSIPLPSADQRQTRDISVTGSVGARSGAGSTSGGFAAGGNQGAGAIGNNGSSDAGQGAGRAESGKNNNGLGNGSEPADNSPSDVKGVDPSNPGHGGNGGGAGGKGGGNGRDK